MISIDIHRAEEVRALYERFPYPSPSASAQPIFDIAMGLDFVVEELAGREVLDAGCGTGHRLVGLACQYPETTFVGVDFSERSLSIARDLAERNECTNVEFIRAEIGGVGLGRQFDLITSTGVIHHLENPEGGADWLQRHLKPDGILYTWYYHPYGEFDRLLSRELVQLFLSRSKGDLSDTILSDLELSLSARQYGTRTSHSDAGPQDQLAADADAYLHPIVNAYKFQEAAEFFRRRCDWVVVNGVNWDGGSNVIDTADWSGNTYGTVALSDLFRNERLHPVFAEMDAQPQLDCVELKLRPTGFSLVSGPSAGLRKCTDRIRRNAERANLLDRGNLSTTRGDNLQ
ncbi:class I SAM-dependent methyltransferase [Streptomyces sp. NPDC050535]|uniref:class I SAM-dependent methyltransferase n=1 Tax=Streptomyces sp. NPDC050535 TaxID=3365626 RepID=UPI0037BC1AB5